MDIIKLKLQAKQSITVLTGAGISAESGVPTFRGSDGLWKNFQPEQLATLEAFQADPCLVWEWYDWRRKLIEPIKPNPAHYALVEIEAQTEQFTLITQNIDGLHHKAGSQNVLEIHGNIWKVQCTKCQCLSHNSEVPIQILPTCRQCGGLLRPKVVWFGETLPAKELEAAQFAATHCSLMFIIGTSGLVQPAASLGVAGKQAGAYVVEINIEQTPLSNIADETRIGKASDILTDLLS
ncbi:MAG: NAD-dependent deacylase [Candidatus Poribacteria bacterium]|nr:NAD-dependent deacylase [Candidatus Poribacteria bacterium]